jgi:hypothetical protein
MAERSVIKRLVRTNYEEVAIRLALEMAIDPNFFVVRGEASSIVESISTEAN